MLRLNLLEQDADLRELPNWIDDLDTGRQMHLNPVVNHMDLGLYCRCKQHIPFGPALYS